MLGGGIDRRTHTQRRAAADGRTDGAQGGRERGGGGERARGRRPTSLAAAGAHSVL